MKVYYIWDTKDDCVVTSRSSRWGFYTSLLSVIFAYTRLSWLDRNDEKFVIKEAELSNVKELDL
jgi:hypothetical protein